MVQESTDGVRPKLSLNWLWSGSNVARMQDSASEANLVPGGAMGSGAVETRAHAGSVSVPLTRCPPPRLPSSPPFSFQKESKISRFFLEAATPPSPPCLLMPCPSLKQGTGNGERDVAEGESSMPVGEGGGAGKGGGGSNAGLLGGRHSQQVRCFFFYFTLKCEERVLTSTRESWSTPLLFAF